MEDPRGPCDEMFIYVLSKVHFRHTIVYNMKRPWCTIQPTELLSEDELHAVCDLHLIYLGQDVYGELRCLVGAKESLQVYDAGVTVIEMLPDQTPAPAPGNTGAKTNKVLLVNLPPRKVETYVPAITTDDLTPASSKNAAIDGSSSDNDLLEHSPTPVSPCVSQSVNPLLPPLTPIILPLKHLVVEYLKGCDSKLVNPAVLNIEEGGNRPENPVSADSPVEPTVEDRNIYDDNDVKSLNSENALDYNDYLLNTMTQRRYSVVVKKISVQEINRWTGKVPHWTDIDPYSDLEDVGSEEKDVSTDSKETESPIVSSDDDTTPMNKRVLRLRMRHYASERPRRFSAKDKFYRGQCSELRQRVTSAKHRVKPLSEPSKERQDARRYNLRKLKQLNYTYSIVPEKSTQPAESDTDTEPSISSDDTIIDTNATVDNTKDDEQKPSPKAPKGKFVTETFGIKNNTLPDNIIGKKARKRNYYCSGSSCDKVFDKMSLLNQHYKSSHEPVSCHFCGLTFNTLSTLQRHLYVHKELKYPCPHCEHKFPFESDLNVHVIKHESDRQVKCKECSKLFFMKGDMIKHEQVHKKIVWKCSLCTYETYDKRNLKAHQCRHSNLKPYLCTYCLKLFRYPEQLKRHCSKPCNNSPPKDADSSSKSRRRSDSPEY